MPVTLTDDEFAPLYIYLDRDHTITWDPNTVGQNIKLGGKLMAWLEEIAKERAPTS